MVRDVITSAYVRAVGFGEDLYVRHGACETGADRLAQCTVERMKAQGANIHEEKFPARWQHENCVHHKGHRSNGEWYCKPAGNIRNQEMIDEGGIDEVHAFPLPGGTGTFDCVCRAASVGLVVTNHGFPMVTMGQMLRRNCGRI